MSEDGSRDVTAADIEAAREEVIEAMARAAEACGSKRSYGRLFGILYFADDPLSLGDLAEESGYAKSTVSTAMTTLERIDLVRRRSLPGEGKRAYFEAEEDFWAVFQGFLDQQVRRELEALARALEVAELVLSEADDDRAGTDREKVRRLGETIAHSEALVDAMASDQFEDVTALTERLESDE